MEHKLIFYILHMSIYYVLCSVFINRSVNFDILYFIDTYNSMQASLLNQITLGFRGHYVQ